MAKISQQIKIENEPESIQMKFKRTIESKDYLADVLPFAGNMKQY